MNLEFIHMQELRGAVMNLLEECKKLKKNILQLNDLIHRNYDVPDRSDSLHGHKYNLEKGTLIGRLRDEE